MRKTLHPSHFAPALLPEYLDRLFEEVLSVAYEALENSQTPYDTDYTRGTLLYGRLQGLCRELNRDKSAPWFQLCNSTMDFTVSINGVMLQIVTDDPSAPKKAHRLKASEMELSQLSLFDAMPEIYTWRLFVDSNHDLEFPVFEATLVGFDINKNVLCLWTYEQRHSVPVKSLDLPPSVDVEEAEPKRRSKEPHERSNNGVSTIDE